VVSKPHYGELDTYTFIAKFIAPNFFFSVNDGWGRMGFLGVFGDYILSCTKGDVLEIGCGESSIYLSKVATKYGRKIYHCEIAPSKIENPLTVPGYMNPDIGYFFTEGSDKMFETIHITPIALAFIDGDHVFEQVQKDFNNVLPYVVDDGYIILHDTYPPNESFTTESTCGTVYKLRQLIEKDDRFDCITLPTGTAMDVGLTICRKKKQNRAFYNE
jgi:hypothetical protein